MMSPLPILSIGVSIPLSQEGHLIKIFPGVDPVRTPKEGFGLHQRPHKRTAVLLRLGEAEEEGWQRWIVDFG